MNRSLPRKFTIGFAVALIAVAANALISYRNTTQLVQNEERVAHTLQVLAELESTLSALKDAETGQKGYVLTGDETYLQPYREAIAIVGQQIASLKKLTADNPDQQRRLAILEQQANSRLKQLQQTIILRQTQGLEAARQDILAGQGKQIMDEIRQLVAEMERTEEFLLAQRARESQNSIQRTTITFTLASLFGIGLLSFLYVLVRHDLVQRKQTEALLKQTKDDLETRAAERTIELLRVNQQLQQELDDRKQIQTALQISQARFAGILEIASDAIISVDANQRITLFNQGAEKIFGYRAEDAIGQLLDLLLPQRAIAAHHQHLSGFAQSENQARRMGERSEIFARRKDGSEFPAEASISRLNLDNDTIFTAILRDISDRKQTELTLSQQAAIIESSGDAIISADLTGKIISWNLSAERLYGYTSEEAIGQSIRLIMPTHRFGEEKQILQTIQQGGQIQYIETTGQRKNGTSIEVGLSFSPVRDAANRIVGVSAIARDITDRKQIDRMKDEFISIVSHELRTPLTSIHGSLGMLASGLLNPDSDQAKRMLQIAVDSTDRLVRLINDILDIERIESGRVRMEKERCAVNDLITEAVNVMQPLADKAGVLLSATSSPLQVWADPDRIVQTLTNLLSNAIKFSSSGNTVGLMVQLQPKTVLFTVKDQGRGIPTDKLSSIFERFQQVDSSDSRNHEGTGLGLAICRSIVQQHDGQIWAESVLGEGSTFFFTLPLQEDQELDLPVELLTEQDVFSSTPLVLICDGEANSGC